MSTNPEELLISAALRTGDYMVAASRGITRKFFHSYFDEWAFIENYVDAHKTMPSVMAFQSKFPDFRVKKADDVAFFCEEVRKSHVQHEVSFAVQNIISKLEVGDVDKAVKMMHQSSLAIESQLAGMSGDSDVIQHWEKTYEEVMRRSAVTASTGQAGIPTGFPTLDERTGGPQPGQVWIVSARLGQGKTWSLIRMAVAACFSGYNVQYDALEQSRNEIAMRLHTFASSESGKEIFKALDLAQGKNFSPRAYKEFLNRLKDNEDVGRFHIADTSGGPIGPMSIAAQIERNKPDVLFLDYITLAETPSGSTDWQGMAGLSKAIKQLAQKHEIPIVAAAQLNRSAAAGKELSGPEHLAGSDDIGRDADAVITMRQLSKRVIAMKLAKNRHGPDGFTWYTIFRPNTGHFEEVTRDEAMDAIDEDKAEEEESTTAFKPRQKGSFAATAKARKILAPTKSSSKPVRKIRVVRTKP